MLLHAGRMVTVSAYAYELRGRQAYSYFLAVRVKIQSGFIPVFEDVANTVY